ncbi:MAG: DUF1800 domain-containing protein [Saprospiraceae bacterium]
MSFRFLLLVSILVLSAPLLSQESKVFGGLGSPPYQIISSDITPLKDYLPFVDKNKVMDGSGMNNQANIMNRLMRQASMGLTEVQMETIRNTEPTSWITEQLEITPINFLDYFNQVVEETRNYRLQYSSEDFEFGSRTSTEEFRIAYWRYLMEHADFLRQKVVYALSQIFVVSDMVGQIQDHGEGLASYTEILSKNAFGNFKNLLRDITLEPIMGMFLSHLNNSKEIPHLNIHPDENYAREIMQLFTIGLFELDLNGIPKRDGEGQLIPTYDQSDIKNLAKVFTGLGPGKTGLYASEEMMPNFGMGRFLTDFTYPMAMYESYHDQTEKIIVGNYVIPANQAGMDDIELALNHLFNHANVGPFIGKQLIQKLVTSNPSPDYVEDIAAVFNDNGHGIRGDLKAVVKAILLHPEARSCESSQDPSFGKLQEPFLRYLTLIKSIDLQPNENGEIFYNGQDVFKRTTQNFLRAPTVFNFYKPNYSPFGPLRTNNLMGPEFQIHNSTTSIDMINGIEEIVKTEYGMNYSWEVDVEGGFYKNNFDHFNSFSNDNEALINYIDQLFTGGQMTLRTRDILKNALIQFDIKKPNQDDKKVRLAVFLALISPDFAILK